MNLVLSIDKYTMGYILGLSDKWLQLSADGNDGKRMHIIKHEGGRACTIVVATGRIELHCDYYYKKNIIGCHSVRQLYDKS